MSTVAKAPRFDVVHDRVLEQLLAQGQSASRVALVDLASAVVLSRGPATGGQRPIEDETLAAFGRCVFAFDSSSESTREQVRELCAGLGGVSAVAILMRGAGLFVGRLPGSSRVLSLMIHHGESSALASETVMRARAIRSRLESENAADADAQAEPALVRGYSVWKSLVEVVSPYFAGAPTPAKPLKQAPHGLLKNIVAGDDHVLGGDLFDLADGTHLDHYRHARAPRAAIPEPGTATAALNQLFGGTFDVRAVLQAFGFVDSHYGKVQIQVGDLDFYWLRVPFSPAMHIPFGNDTALLLYKKPRPNPALDWLHLDLSGLNLLRMRIGSLLVAGMKTEMFPFPQTPVEFQNILDRLGALPKDDLIRRLDIGGFAAHPVAIDDVKQRCRECTYYLPHRKWCDLPELPVPVEPNWWCRLWKI